MFTWQSYKGVADLGENFWMKEEVGGGGGAEPETQMGNGGE